MVKILRDGPDGAPKYSLGIRLTTTLKSQSPGPAKYLPGKNSGLPRPPEFTFGVKGPFACGFNTPGKILDQVSDMSTVAA